MERRSSSEFDIKVEKHGDVPGHFIFIATGAILDVYEKMQYSGSSHLELHIHDGNLIYQDRTYQAWYEFDGSEGDLKSKDC